MENVFKDEPFGRDDREVEIDLKATITSALIEAVKSQDDPLTWYSLCVYVSPLLPAEVTIEEIELTLRELVQSGPFNTDGKFITLPA